MTAEITHNRPEGITGGIADVFCGGVPDAVREKVRELLKPDLWSVVEKFCKKFR